MDNPSPSLRQPWISPRLFDGNKVGNPSPSVIYSSGVWLIIIIIIIIKSLLVMVIVKAGPKLNTYILRFLSLRRHLLNFFFEKKKEKKKKFNKKNLRQVPNT